MRSDGGEQSYCVYARAGQTMKVTVKPLVPHMVTQGNVISPLRTAATISESDLLGDAVRRCDSAGDGRGMRGGPLPALA
jgi:hypothetical protein